MRSDGRQIYMAHLSEQGTTMTPNMTWFCVKRSIILSSSMRTKLGHEWSLTRSPTSSPLATQQSLPFPFHFPLNMLYSSCIWHNTCVNVDEFRSSFVFRGTRHQIKYAQCWTNTSGSHKYSLEVMHTFEFDYLF